MKAPQRELTYPKTIIWDNSKVAALTELQRIKYSILNLRTNDEEREEYSLFSSEDRRDLIKASTFISTVYNSLKKKDSYKDKIIK